MQTPQRKQTHRFATTSHLSYKVIQKLALSSFSIPLVILVLGKKISKGLCYYDLYEIMTYSSCAPSRLVMYQAIFKIHITGHCFLYFITFRKKIEGHPRAFISVYNIIPITGLLPNSKNPLCNFD